MEIRIGVQHSARELVLESEQSQEEVQKLIEKALSKPESGTLLTLNDEKGRKILVPADKLAYIEIGAVQAAKVGFGI